MIEIHNQAQPTIVVLDDDQLVLRAVNRMLRSFFAGRLAVVCANDPERLRQLLPYGIVVLLITDGNMGPGVPNGVEVIAEARKTVPGLPCILHSSSYEHLSAVTPDSRTGIVQKPDSAPSDFRREIERIAPHLLKESPKSTT